jgi:hypothetical protein
MGLNCKFPFREMISTDVSNSHIYLQEIHLMLYWATRFKSLRDMGLNCKFPIREMISVEKCK